MINELGLIDLETLFVSLLFTYKNPKETLSDTA